MDIQSFISFLAYFSILLGIGLSTRKKQMSSADFSVGNRSLNFWVTAMSAHASDMSSWLFMAFPAAIYLGGMHQFWIAIGLLLGMYMNWELVATKLRVLTEKYEAYTLSSFFEKRFSDTTGIIRISTAFMTLFFLTCYVTAGLIGVGGIFESVFGINFALGLTIACIFITIYIFAGGFLTVAYTDFFQAVFLLGVIITVPTLAFLKMDHGLQAIQDTASLKQISLSILPELSFSSILGIVLITLSWGLGYFGQPHIVTKFMGIKNVQDMKKSKYFGMSWMFVALSAASFVGLIGLPYFSQGLANPEFVFVEMVKSLFYPWVAGFLLCGVFAASLSTIDSQILVCASVLSEDFYKYFLNKKATNRQLVTVSRIGVVSIAAISLFLALNKNSTILEAVLYAWSGLGSSFGPLVLMALYSKSVNKFGAIAGILVGGVTAGTWEMINGYITDHAIPSMIPGFFLSLISIYIVSEITNALQVSEADIPTHSTDSVLERA